MFRIPEKKNVNDLVWLGTMACGCLGHSLGTGISFFNYLDGIMFVVVGRKMLQ